MRIHSPPKLNVAQQLLALRSNPISHGTGEARLGQLSWSYLAQPTPLSRSYRVQIAYRLGESPKIYVRDPVLADLAPGRRLPHVYGQRPARLCLYLPNSGEWSPQMRLDQTIVPWTALWLFFFEDWLATDEWKGGGVHPGENDVPH